MPRRFHARLNALERCVTPQQARWLFEQYAVCLDRSLERHGMPAHRRRVVIRGWLAVVEHTLAQWPPLLAYALAEPAMAWLMERLRVCAVAVWDGPEPIEVMWGTFAAELERIVVPEK